MKLTKNKLLLIGFLLAALVLTFIWGGNYGGKNRQANDEALAEALTTIARQTTLSRGDGAVESDSQLATEATTEAAPAATAAGMSIDPNTGKDKYLTDPVPAGKPIPVEWQDVEIDTDTVYHCQLSVHCNTILDNLDIFNRDKLEVLPRDGVILPLTTVQFYKGESVFNVLQREMKRHGIHMEFVMTPMYNSVYVEGINNLYEFDTGELSGWMYKVNDWFPNYGASRYQLVDGDVVEWVYTCDLGRDVGGFAAVIVDELPEDKREALEERIREEQLEETTVAE